MTGTRTALAAAARALCVAACGETVIDSPSPRTAIEGNLERPRGLKVTSVDCPSDVEVEGHDLRMRRHRADGKEETATLKIRNEDADVAS